MSYAQLSVTDRWLSSIVKRKPKSYKLVKLQDQIASMAKLKLDASKKPIMSATLEAEIEAALVQYTQKRNWIAWGMDSVRRQGNLVFLGGPPGTGKTSIAEYLSKRVGRGRITLNMKDVGGKAPGHTERMVSTIFDTGTVNGYRTIVMDECEAILWDRGRAGSDSMWMVGVIDEILMKCAIYKGLIIACTNRVDIIDPALMDRCFAILQIGLPEHPERVRLWKQKMPEKFPLRLTTVQLETLAEVPITGRQIENAIVREASMAIQAKRLPQFPSLLAMAKAAHRV